MTRGTKILLFGLMGGGLAMVLICGGVIFLLMKGMQEFPKATASADAFLDLLKNDKVDQAYQSTSKDFQRKVTLEKFREIVVKYPAFTGQTTRNMGGIKLFQTGQGVRASLQYYLANTNNTLSLNLVLKNENNSWKVESINLP